MKITSNLKGQIAASKAELRALELGYIPSRPIFDTRYDLILDNSKCLIKVQIKYADGKITHSQGAVNVHLEYNDRRHNSFTYQEAELDGLIVYFPKIDRLCFFPPKIYVGKKRLCVRLKPPKNHQTRGIILADNYLW